MNRTWRIISTLLDNRSTPRAGIETKSLESVWKNVKRVLEMYCVSPDAATKTISGSSENRR